MYSGTSRHYLLRFQMHVSCDPAFLLPENYPADTLTRAENDACTRLFMEALFVVANDWKQGMCPSGGDR